MSTLNKKKEIIFSEIIKNISSKIEQVVIFLALLDLMKNNSIKIVQNDVFAKISIIKK